MFIHVLSLLLFIYASLHLTFSHDIELKIRTLTFESYIKFLEWKEKEEVQTDS